MTEKELIAKIRELRQIQPRKDWVVLTKTRILGTTEGERVSLSWLKLIFAPALAVFVLIGLFSFSHYSLPGDFLYTFKKVIEKGQAVFVSESQKPQYNLKMADKRLEELNKISQNNQVGNLAPALKEYKTTKVAAKKKVLSAIKNKSNEETIKIAKEIAPKLIEVDKKEKEVYATLDLDIEPTNEGTNGTAEKALAEVLINDAENLTLTQKQAEDLLKVKGYYENGDYAAALESYLTSSLNPNYGK